MEKQVAIKQVNKKEVRKRTYLVLAAFAVLAVIVTVANWGGTLAWYNNAQSHGVDVSSAKIYYTMEGSVPTEGILQPNQNLLAGITLTNFSTAPSNIRFKVQYDYYINTGSEAAPVYTKQTSYAKVAPSANVEDAPADQYFDVSFDTAAYSYVQYSEDGWWEKTATVAPIAEENLLMGEAVPVFAAGDFVFCYNGERTGNAFAGKPVTVTFVFQAKQAEGVTWQNIGTVTAYIPASGG